jgi:hypothetical protein
MFTLQPREEKYLGEAKLVNTVRRTYYVGGTMSGQTKDRTDM